MIREKKSAGDLIAIVVSTKNDLAQDLHVVPNSEGPLLLCFLTSVSSS